MAFKIIEVKTANGGGLIEIVAETGSKFWGSLRKYNVRVFAGRGRKIELDKKRALVVVEELFRNKGKWAKAHKTYKDGFEFKTVHVDYPHSNFYIKNFVEPKVEPKEDEETTDSKGA